MSIGLERENLCRELLKHSDRVVIVEGTRDRAALLAFGFKRIHTLEKDPVQTALNIVEQDVKIVLILTDFDEEGSQLAASLSRILERMGVKIDRVSRRKLKFLALRAGLTSIEAFTRLI